MLPIVFLEEAGEKANLKAFIKYISQLQLTAEKIPKMSDSESDKSVDLDDLFE